MTRINIPKESSEIDEQWLSTVMKTSLKGQDVEILNISDIDGPNHGFVNGVKKASIKVGKTSIPLFLKFSAYPISSYCRMVQSYNCHHREVIAYQHILPQMIEFEKQFGHSDLEGKTPKIFYGDFDETGFILIMEDHSDSYFMRSVNQGLNFLEAKNALEMIASFHATSHAMILKDFPQIKQQKNWSSVHQSFGQDSWYQAEIEANFEALINDLSEEKPTLVWPLQNLTSKWRKVYAEVTNYGSNPPFLIHGDLWANNMMFSHQNQVLVFDWPFLGQAHPIIDVAHFIFVGLDPQNVEEWADKLLHIYCQAFTRKCRLYGIFEKSLMIQELTKWFWNKGIMVTIMMWIAGYKSVMYQKPELRSRFIHLLEKSYQNSPEYFTTISSE